MNDILPTEVTTLKDISISKGLRKVQYEKMMAGLNATKKTTELVDGKMVVTEEPDHNVIHKFWADSMRMTGDIKPEASVDNRVINISNVTPDSVNGLLSMIKNAADRIYSMKTNGRQTGEIIDVIAE